MCSRTAPYTPSRSQSATAGISRRAASATRDSGSDPARRNENALRAWSSTYGMGTTALVQHPLDAPAVRGSRQLVDAPLGKLDLPRLGSPRPGPPPVARGD